jgi:hypothetical protein
LTPGPLVSMPGGGPRFDARRSHFPCSSSTSTDSVLLLRSHCSAPRGSARLPTLCMASDDGRHPRTLSSSVDAATNLFYSNVCRCVHSNGHFGGPN